MSTESRPSKSMGGDVRSIPTVSHGGDGSRFAIFGESASMKMAAGAPELSEAASRRPKILPPGIRARRGAEWQVMVTHRRTPIRSLCRLDFAVIAPPKTGMAVTQGVLPIPFRKDEIHENYLPRLKHMRTDRFCEAALRRR
ncbi:MAG: hypothetical protein IE913_07100 [Halothiobacillus sp.]|nr:hypothetical protein [Halothiobacillus sp.]